MMVPHRLALIAVAALVFGGLLPGTPAARGAEPPAVGAWATAAPLSDARIFHTATTLADGRVLVAGRAGGTSADLYGRAAEPSACFAETGRCISGRFLEYWRANGGLARNGYPLSEVRIETLEDGLAYQVQYFERARFEYHPENAAPFDVLLGQFGRRIRPADPPVAPLPGARHFPETGHNLSGGFLAYWAANGGLPAFGFPISEPFEQELEDRQTYRVQYFERARFEYHPENAPPFDLLLGQFGRRILTETQLLGGAFGRLYNTDPALRVRTGLPVGGEAKRPGATQAFERGRMLYDADERTILVLCGQEPGRWSQFVDTRAEGDPVGGGPGPAPGLFEPKLGFGKLWRENAEVRDCLGYARSADEAVATLVVQPFERARMFFAATPEGPFIYVLHGDGSFERYGV